MSKYVIEEKLCSIEMNNVRVSAYGFEAFSNKRAIEFVESSSGDGRKVGLLLNLTDWRIIAQKYVILRYVQLDGGWSVVEPDLSFWAKSDQEALARFEEEKFEGLLRLFGFLGQIAEKTC